MFWGLSSIAALFLGSTADVTVGDISVILGKEPVGDVATGDVATGDVATGDVATGDVARGDVGRKTSSASPIGSLILGLQIK